MINAEVIQLTKLCSKRRRRDARDLCVY